MPSSVRAEDDIPITDLKAAEQVLSKADHVWLGGDVTKAVPQYEALNLANRTGSKDVHGETLAELEPHLVPWYPIPLDLIGPYSE
jgi:hypothetical protein